MVTGRGRAGSQFIALIRAINVGGHTVRMERLRELFEAMGFTSVETFIASGNVIFESPTRSATALEKQIAEALATGLGYDVATFVRSPAEIAAVVGHQPFPPAELDLPVVALYVGFLHAPPAAEATDKVLALRTADDDLHIDGRELYWLARRKTSESKLSNARLERALGMPMTMRNITTVRKLAAKYPAPSPDQRKSTLRGRDG